MISCRFNLRNILLVCFLFFFHFPAQAESSDFRKGLWIESEGVVRPLSHPLEFKRLLATLDKYDFTDVYVQVYRNGKSWFHSDVSDITPFLENQKHSFNPVSELISFCKKKNIRVHAWMNVLRMNEHAPFIQKTGESAVLHDKTGLSLLKTKGEGVPGCRPDTPGIWLDPDNVEVRKNTLMVISELISEYPDISGIHFDYIRYPFPIKGEAGRKSPYCNAFSGIDKIKEDKIKRTRLSEQLLDSELRTNQSSNGHGVTNLLKIVRRYLDIKAPQLEVSGAVISSINRAKNHASQNWPLWLRAGLLDNVVTMNYTTDEKRFYKQAYEGSLASRGKILVGIGAWLSLDEPQNIERDLENIKMLNVSGSVLFSYANLAGKRGEPIFNKFNSFKAPEK